MNCGRCRFWGKSDETDQEFRTCTVAAHDDDGMTKDDNFLEYVGDTTDQEVVLTPSAIEYRRSHRAVVLDGSGYFAALKSREDFGCVLFEERK